MRRELKITELSRNIFCGDTDRGTCSEIKVIFDKRIVEKYGAIQVFHTQ